MKREQIIEKMKKKGWTVDRWNHLKYNNYRLKMQSKSVRFERKENKSWFKINSRTLYYKDINDSVLERIDKIVKTR